MTEHTQTKSQENKFANMEELKQGFLDWRQSHPEFEEKARIASQNPDIPRLTNTDNPEIVQEIFMYYMFGADLARKDCQAALDVEIPELEYSIKTEVTAARINTENNEVSMQLGPKIFEYIYKKFSDRETEHQLNDKHIQPLILLGAHEFAHIVLSQKVSNNQLMIDISHEKQLHYRFHDYLTGTLDSIDNVTAFYVGNYYEDEDPLSVYDSSLEELMAVIWEKRIVQNHMSWDKRLLNGYTERIRQAREYQNKIGFKYLKRNRRRGINSSD